MTIPNKKLALLYNTSMFATRTPGRWLTTLLAAILKRGKNALDPESYRTIGLECVLLKMLTLLIDKRVRAWAEARKLLPPTQNGFRPGFRTNNNAFILRCAAERAAADGKPLFVASVDLTNAFPSVDRPLLWLKLKSMGMSGPVFDLYRHIYDNMTYVVRMHDEFSEWFSSNIGVLIGDPASPIMWDLFFADFALPARPDDIKLGGTCVSHLEHADDVIIMSTTREGLQAHLNSVAEWASLAFLTINVDKTWALCLGASQVGDVFLHLQNRHIALAAGATYVGMSISANDKHIFRAHYTVQANKARAAGARFFAAQGMTGSTLR